MILAVSHKGGTGRTVTITNLAYRLVTRGHSACLVDLDLASPTLGAVTHVVGSLRSMDLSLAVGRDADARQGVHDFLLGRESADVNSALANLYDKPFQVKPPRHAGEFALLPGTRSSGDLEIEAEVLEDRLFGLLTTLSRRFDFVLADMRSGLSAVANALLQARFEEVVTSWLVHYRWTHQHLAGLDDILSQVAPYAQSTGLIRTVYHDPAGYEGGIRDYIVERDNSLRAEEQRICRKHGVKDPLGRVPFEQVLQWEEGIIEDGLAESGMIRSSTLASLDLITDRLVDGW